MRPRPINKLLVPCAGRLVTAAPLPRPLPGARRELNSWGPVFAGVGLGAAALVCEHLSQQSSRLIAVLRSHPTLPLAAIRTTLQSPDRAAGTPCYSCIEGTVTATQALRPYRAPHRRAAIVMTEVRVVEQRIVEHVEEHTRDGKIHREYTHRPVRHETLESTHREGDFFLIHDASKEACVVPAQTIADSQLVQVSDIFVPIAIIPPEEPTGLALARMAFTGGNQAYAGTLGTRYVEKILPMDHAVTALGQFSLNDGNPDAPLVFTAPASKELVSHIALQTKRALIEAEQGSSELMRVAARVCAGLSVTALVYAVASPFLHAHPDPHGADADVLAK